MWTFEESNDVDELKRRIEFLRSALSQRGGNAFRPAFVPERVRIREELRSELPQMFSGRVAEGVYLVNSNQWGAISVTVEGGQFGIRPHECVVLNMKPNPHLRKDW